MDVFRILYIEHKGMKVGETVVVVVVLVLVVVFVVLVADIVLREM